MNKIVFVFIFKLIFLGLHAQSSDITGMWKNYDDEDGQEKSHIEIVKKNDKYYATVVKLLPQARLTHCEKCKGDMKGKKIEGMEIFSGLEKTGKNTWGEGKILNPKNGKEYSCKLELEDVNTLKVRGYIGAPTFGKTQVWHRVK
jgi:uncharacterized protein (DUF2147 family)